MLSFKSLTDRNFLPALTLYNEATQRGEQYNCTLDEKGFIQLFLTPAKPGDAYFALYESSERGFIIGHFDGGMKKFFLTTVQVAPAHRRQGIGSALINALAEEMQRFASAHDLPDPEPESS